MLKKIFTLSMTLGLASALAACKKDPPPAPPQTEEAAPSGTDADGSMSTDEADTGTSGGDL